MTSIERAVEELAYPCRRVELPPENRRQSEQALALEARLADLQAVNEAAYARDYDATGGPRFDTEQPFGHEVEPQPGPSPRVHYRFLGGRGGL
ncbi:hypothetical protein OG393_30790 [Streptomyces sp. NBC_01216]|uniref:hypothetical protein n=1 Tax=Streptomyces sp. NBC_01216 TaxID=2903778 RepID=UPI002E0D7A58|nr:hypothetical protein OG393_30790 [Streptomyces sp. NBC_01216]